MVSLSESANPHEQEQIFSKMEQSLVHKTICRMMSTPLFLSFFGVSGKQIRMIREESPNGLNEEWQLILQNSRPGTYGSLHLGIVKT